MSKILFKAEHAVEEYWDVTIDGTTIKIPDKYMRELVFRYGKKHGLKITDKEGNPLIGIFGH